MKELASWWKLPSHDEYPTAPYLTLSNGSWYSPTLDATDKTKATIRVFATVAGTQVTLQQASDAETWTNVTILTPPVNQFYYFDYTIAADFLRFVSTQDAEITVVFE